MIAIGTRFGPYEVLGRLGAGGMGEVYRARDPRLDRDVAIKILPSDFTDDPDRRARFEREARLLAALNHPNIAQIYGMEDTAGVQALVMELVEGVTLDRLIEGAADRASSSRQERRAAHTPVRESAAGGAPQRQAVLPQGGPLRGAPLPLDQALDIARQIADGLEAAHEKGIIHRDLKPTNIAVTPDGTVKLLDFGLAKASAGEPVADRSQPTMMAVEGTSPGMILGTPAYMSPEQTRGRLVDKRADIWAFGCVLYEMLTGRLAFARETASDTIAAILERDPAWETLSPTLPVGLHRLLRRCLEKDPKHRLRDIGDARIEIHEAMAGPKTARPKAASDLRSTTGRRTRRAEQMPATRSPDQSLVRLSVDLGPDAVAGLRTTAVLSPDGRRLAFLARGTDGRQRLATRLLEHAQPVLLAGTENAQDPFFSPNGEWLGFFADYKLKRVSVQGGSPVTLCEAPNDRGASWADDDTIILAPHIYGGLFRVPGSGGPLQALTHLSEGEVAHAWPDILPGRQAVLFTGGTAAAPNVQVFSFASGETKVVAGPGYRGRYLPSGHLVYVHHSTLFAVPFDTGSLEARGVPVPLLDDVADDAGDRTAHFDCARDGTLVYLRGKAVSSARMIAWMDPSGKTEPLLETPGRYSFISPSPDGKRLAFAAGFPEDHIWVLDLHRGRPSRLTFATVGNQWPQWSPDGQHLVFNAQNGDRPGSTLWWIRADGAGEPQRLLESAEELHPSSVAPDGRHIALHRRSAETLYDIVMLPLDTTDPEHPRPGTPEIFLRTPVNEWGAVFSPDGRWIAYYSEESGTGEIYVRPFRGPGGPWLVSSGSGIAGIMAHWPRHGRALYYLSSDKHVMEVAYSAGTHSFASEEPRTWSEVTIPFASFNLSPDGGRAIIVVPVDPGTQRGTIHVMFLLNAFEELRRRVPVGSKPSR
jgi:serine/threonine protein kinase/Tol biopolymer transport system component